MPADDLSHEVLRLIKASGYQPVKPRVLAKKLGLSQEHMPALRRALRQLVKEGRATFGPKHLVLAGNESASDRLTGVFRRHPDGHGFVRPTRATPSAAASDDVYVAAEDARDASTGDLVIVRLKERPRHGRPGKAGYVAQIVERDTHQFVGTYSESQGGGWVLVDGAVFSRPIAVGDPGAKGVQPDDKVVIEMIRFPTHTHDGEGVLLEVLGPRGAPGVDTKSIIREYGLPEAFPDDVLDEAREQAGEFNETVPPGRTDLTAEPAITIDPADARDFDDAISLDKDEDGGWRLSVHIADVAHFVPLRSALDREAHRRATSVYLPDRVLPMLPEAISNSLASLQPGRVRYTKTVVIHYTPDGAVVDCEFLTAAIKSRRRFTYDEVDEFLAHRQAWSRKLAPEVFALLERMYELAMILRRRRVKRGSLELSMPEVRIVLDRHGRVSGARRVMHTESHQIIEEFMLAANEAVATRLAETGIGFLRRVHASPDPRKMQALSEFVTGLGLTTRPLQDRFALQRLLKDVAHRPEAAAVNYAVLRSLQRAVYAPIEEGHYALAIDHYCHFTSPIRRYPDLTIHRLLDRLVMGRRPASKLDELSVLGEHCSSRERRAEEAERELTKIKLLGYLSGRLGEELDGVITGVEAFGFFVQGLELPAEGLVHLSSLSDDFYRFDRRSHTLSGHREGNSFRLGDKVRVAVVRVDVDRRELDFRLVDHTHAGKRPRVRKGADRGDRKARGGSSAKAGRRTGAPPKKSRRRGREGPRR
jgi:ribonuclease R